MSRQFAIISKEEFIELVEKECNGCCGYAWPTISKSIEKDLSKCCFSFENFEVAPTRFLSRNIMGVRTLSNRLTFWSMAAGGDWEEPVFFYSILR